MNEVLVQTRLPPKIGRAVEQRAAVQGLSVAAWLRRLITTTVFEGERARPRIDAWVVDTGEDPVKYLASPPTTDYILEHLRDITVTEAVFSMLHGRAQGLAGRPVDPGWLRDTTWFLEHEKHRFVLKGSSRPWAIVRTWWDTTAKRIEVTLRME